MSILVKVLAYLLFILLAWLWAKTIPAKKMRRWLLILLVLIPTLVLDILGIRGDEQAMALIISAIVSAIASYVITKALELPWWRRLLFTLGQALIATFGMTVVTIVLMMLTVIFFKAKSAVIA